MILKILGATGNPIAIAISIYQHRKQVEQNRSANADVAELKVRAQRLYEKLAEKMGAQDQYFDLMTATYSVAIAFVADGKAVPESLRLEIEEFMFGRGASRLPVPRRSRLIDIAAAPPTRATAVAVVKQHGSSNFPFFEDAISLALRLKGQSAAQAAETIDALFSDLQDA